jgi:hemerythrin-like domain-containing protein
MSNNEKTSEGLRARLVQDHQELDQLFQALLSALRADARDETGRLWAAFDDGLSRHMAVEEQEILPLLRAHAPQEVVALCDEHDEIRAKLAEFGVAVELHEVCIPLVADFIEQLRSHAQREEALGYRWAEASLPASEQQHVRARLSAGRALRQRLIELGRKAKDRVTATR